MQTMPDVPCQVQSDPPLASFEGSDCLLVKRPCDQPVRIHTGDNMPDSIDEKAGLSIRSPFSITSAFNIVPLGLTVYA